MKNLLILFLLVANYCAGQVNNGGIKSEPSGLQVGIEIPISADTTITTAHKRTAELLSMTFENDLNILITIRINYYTPDGVPMSAAIDTDSTLTPEAKEFLKQRFSSFTVGPKSTRGSVVDSQTKKVLVGAPVSGHVYLPELLLYQQMTRNDLAAMGVTGAGSETRPLQLVYKFATVAMQQILERVGLL